MLLFWGGQNVPVSALIFHLPSKATLPGERRVTRSRGMTFLEYLLCTSHHMVTLHRSHLIWRTSLQGVQTPISHMKKLRLREKKEPGPRKLLARALGKAGILAQVCPTPKPMFCISHSWLFLIFLESLRSHIQTFYSVLLLCCYLLQARRAPDCQ